jgi:spermidine synthase
VDLMHVYSQNFYRLAHRRLMAGGLLAVQATSPYFSRQAFLSILKTIEAAGFSVLPYHNQIPTLGEWGWVLGARAEDFSKEILKRRVLAFDFEGLDTRFFNTGAMISMAHFGKGILEDPDADKIKINTESNPVLMRYYRSGSWGIY